jgi:hypothetical protein
MARIVRLSEPSLPSLGRQALNAAGALGRVALAVATGDSVLVSDEERARRSALCQSCEQYRSDGRCALCGCCAGRGRLVLDKVKYATERCPARPPRWG